MRAGSSRGRDPFLVLSLRRQLRDSQLRRTLFVHTALTYGLEDHNAEEIMAVMVVASAAVEATLRQMMTILLLNNPSGNKSARNSGNLRGDSKAVNFTSLYQFLKSHTSQYLELIISSTQLYVYVSKSLT
jgi:hypothetical protein